MFAKMKAFYTGIIVGVCCSACSHSEPGAPGVLVAKPISAPVVIVDPWYKAATPEQKEAVMSHVKSLAASAHPVKLYFHSESEKDDGTWSWVVARYDGPKQFLGTVEPAVFQELLTTPEYTGASNDSFIHMEAVTEEGETFSFSLYADYRDQIPIPIIACPYYSTEAPQFWKRVYALIEDTYHLRARAPKDGDE